MTKVKLGSILIEQKESVKSPDGKGMDLIGVSNEIGLHVSRAKRIDDLSRYKLIEMGWFAYNPMRVNVGSIGYVFEQDQIGIVSPDYVVFSCSDKILPEYLLYILKSDEGIEAINKNASGAVRKRLYFSDLARIEILLPSIESQRNRLSAFRKIKGLGNQISEPITTDSLVSQLKQSILHEAMQGKLTEEWRKQNPALEPANELLKRIKAEKAQLIKEKKIRKEKPLPPIMNEEIPFELPEGWGWCRFLDLVSYRKGKKPSVLVKEQSKKFNIPYIDIEAFEKGVLKQYTNDPKAILSDASNILLVWDGSRMGLVGKGLDGAVGSTLVKIDLFQIDFNFLYYLLSSKFKFFNSNPKQAGLPHMNGPLLDSMVVALPSQEEQKAIVAKIEYLLDKVNSLETEITQSDQYAQILMQAVLKEAFESKKEVVEA